MRNLVAALFRLEHNRDEQDMLRVLGTLVEWLQAAEQRGLRRAFVVWIRRVLLPNRAPGMELPEFNDLQDLHEVHDMLAERIKKWPEQWEERGIQKGIQKGRMEGRQEAKRETARNLITRTEMDDTMIAEISGLSEAEVKALRAEIKH
jgi:predicted transposase/invertase (TIGR01784 family)